MKNLFIFFRHFLKTTFQKKIAYILHFIAPAAGFTGMFFLLRMAESAAFAGIQALGIVVILSMIQAVLIVSLVLQDKEQGVLKRIRVSPASPLIYVAGNGIAAFFILILQSLFFISFLYLILRIPLGLKFHQLFLILNILNLSNIGLGFLLCSLSNSSSAALVLVNVVVFFTSLMGGSFFPVEFMNPFMQKLALAIPQYWVMKALRETQEAGNFTESRLSLLILLLFGILFITLRGVVERKRGEAGL